jgi:hypothetical protein
MTVFIRNVTDGMSDVKEGEGERGERARAMEGERRASAGDGGREESELGRWRGRGERARAMEGERRASAGDAGRIGVHARERY